jgi:hypothetical protein
VDQGKRLVITGADTTGIESSTNVVRFAECPGRAYETAIGKDFEQASPDSQQAFLDSLQGGAAVQVKAGTQVATSIARTTDGHVNVFFANFAGLVGGSNPEQTPQTGVEISVAAKGELNGFFLPFMGEVQDIKGVQRGESVTFALPAISRGAVFWYEPTEKTATR